MSESTIGVEEAADVVSRGGVVVYPTETVYGLAASVDHVEAVERVFEVKRRSRDEPLSVAFEDVDAALSRTTPSEATEEFMREVLPGPVTVLVPNGAVDDAVVAGRDLVGVRVPDHADARRIAALAGPVTSTSANTSGRPAAASPDDLEPRVVDEVDGVVAAEEDIAVGSGEASTVVDASAWEIVREGADVDRVQALVGK